MPWKETSVMDERIKFIGRLLGGEKMATMCQEYCANHVPVSTEMVRFFILKWGTCC